ncbi:putative polysaccharide biosynthesis protein [Clostridium akagii]|uniref:putative polysaccharide biosynthesis protein n=1 Tax=Clostridium akagii TaxID=91623 RepID=UPI00047E232A|nr:polysaccharide biosynthesis protein [Clostridium akagii]
MKEQSTTKGFAILSIATLFIKVLSAVYNPFLVKILGGETPFGIYNATYQIYVFIYVLTNAGVPSAIAKIVSEYDAVGNYRSALKTFKMARFILTIIGVVMGTLMFVIAGPITNIIGFPEAKFSVMALAPAVLFTSIGSAYRGYFQGRSNMKPTAISQVLEQILNTVFSLGFAALFIKSGVIPGIVGATVGTTLGALASALFLIIVYKKERQTKPSTNHIRHTNKQIIHKIAKYSIPITLSIGLTNVGTLFDTTNTIGRLKVAGLNHVLAEGLSGRYAIFITLIGVPIAIISSLAVNVLPAISRSVALKDKVMVRKKINFALRLCFLIAVPSAVGLSVLSKPIFMLLYPSHIQGYKILVWGAIVLVFMSIVQIQTSILQGLGKIYTVTFYAVIGIAIKIAINYILIAKPKINIYGAIIGSIAGFLIPLIMNSICLQKYLRVKIRLLRHAFKPLVASIFMGAVLYVVYSLVSFTMGLVIKGYINNAVATMIAMFVGMLAYFYALFLTKGITKDDLEIVPQRIKKHIPKRIISNLD